MAWKDGYWTGPLRDGYPESYFESGSFQFPWQKVQPLQQAPIGNNHPGTSPADDSTPEKQ